MTTHIEDHRDGGMNNKIRILAGEPGAGGAPTLYTVIYQRSDIIKMLDIEFQHGPIVQREEDGATILNGISNEALLAIVKDRLEGFQAGPFPCEDNHVALVGIDLALASLKARTAKILARGVEGKLEA